MAGAWEALQRHRDAATFDLRQAFHSDARRFGDFSQPAPQLFADLSKNLIDHEVENLLLQLAHERGVERRRDAMFAGEPINNTEQRAVKHWLLRAPRGAGKDADAAAVHETLDAMLAYA